MADDAVSIKCAVCGSISAPKRCSRCKSAFYCSKEHQLQNWKSHKQSCVVKQATNGKEAKSNSVVCKQTGGTDGVILAESNGRTIKSDVDERHRKVKNEIKEENGVEQLVPETDGSVSKNERGKRANNDSNDTEFSPFDDRPFVSLLFNKPSSYKDADIAKFVVEKMKTNNYCVVDSVFDDDHLDNIVAEIKSMDAKSQLKTGQLAGGRTSGDNSQKVVQTEIRSDRMAWVDSELEGIPNISRAVHRIDSILMCFNPLLKDTDENCFINGRTKVMVTCYPGKGSFYRRHVDNPKADGRRITCILYLNKDWNVQTDGGLLRIFPVDSDTYVDIPPLYNRLLFFWSDCRNPHEVHPAFKARYAMTVWFFDEIERSKAKEDQTKLEVLKLQGDLVLLEKQQRDMEKMCIEQKIENEAMKAVKSLSQQELLALAALTQDHSNPREVLGKLGIAPSIQDCLLKFLKDVQLCPNTT